MDLVTSDLEVCSTPILPFAINDTSSIVQRSLGLDLTGSLMFAAQIFLRRS